MIKIAFIIVAFSGLASGQEYVDSIQYPGWIAGICSPAKPHCPKFSKIEWKSRKQCIYRCVLDEGLIENTPSGHSCGEFSCDVPAIKLVDGNSGAGLCADQNGNILDKPCAMPHWTCADKSRILEFSVDGKGWCRAPMLNGDK